jgi:hypothetical protein
MRQIIVVLLTILMLAATTLSQVTTSSLTFEYGKSEELRGLTKVFVDTGTDLKLRDNIIKEFNKQKKAIPAVNLVDRPEDAEILLVFDSDYDGNFTHGEGYVARPISDTRRRLLFTFKATRVPPFGSKTSSKFVKAFIKAYLEANKET